jgi:hypothetical protein
LSRARTCKWKPRRRTAIRKRRGTRTAPWSTATRNSKKLW